MVDGRRMREICRRWLEAVEGVGFGSCWCLLSARSLAGCVSELNARVSY